MSKEKQEKIITFKNMETVLSLDYTNYDPNEATNIILFLTIFVADADEPNFNYIEKLANFLDWYDKDQLKEIDATYIDALLFGIARMQQQVFEYGLSICQKEGDPSYHFVAHILGYLKKLQNVFINHVLENPNIAEIEYSEQTRNLTQQIKTALDISPNENTDAQKFIGEYKQAVLDFYQKIGV